MKTRRFKALNGAIGEYSKIVEKIATYDENGVMIDCAVIHSSPNEFDGKEYYYPNNKKDDMGLFVGYPKDALDCIKAGLGDVITLSKIFGFSNENVVRFIDREYGENLRKQTLDGWKDTKFAYALKYTFLSSFSDGSKVCKDDTLSLFDTKPEDILTFETENDAKDYATKLIEQTTEYFNEYKNLKRTGNEEYDYENIVKPFFKKIKGEGEHGWNSVYYRIFHGMSETEKSGKTQFVLEPVQIVLS